MSTETTTDETPDEQPDTPAEPAVAEVPFFANGADVPVTKPKFMVVENAFFAQTTDGEIRIPLHFPQKKIRTMSDGLTNVEQVYFLLGEESETCQRLDDLDGADVRVISRKLLQAYLDKERRGLGE